MPRVVARHRGLIVTAGGAAMVVAALSNGEQAMVASSPALAPEDDAGEAGATNPPILNIIGGNQNDYSTFEGDLDEVAVYPMPLALVQMQLHYKLAGSHVGGS